MIYFIQRGTDGPIKIGFTASDETKMRLTYMQVGCPWPLTERALIDGDEIAEKAMHRKFDYARVRGEWFYPVVEILQFIESSIQPCVFSRDYNMSDFQSLIRTHPGARMRITRELNLSSGAVYQWKQVPAERVLDVERVTGITRYELRPDIYGDAPAGVGQE